MNIYLVVEGSVCEMQVYSHWVPLVNPSLRLTRNIDDIDGNSVFMISGCGYPNYFDIISAAIEDISGTDLFDRLVIAIDSENMTYEEKRTEIDTFVRKHRQLFDYRIIVQHFCLETWALGNKAIVPRNNPNELVRLYRSVFDVLVRDPELLPDFQGLNRAQFAEKYLRCMLLQKFSKISYSKRNPKALLHPTYFQKVKDRFNTTGHIASFNDFLTAFI